MRRVGPAVCAALAAAATLAGCDPWYVPDDPTSVGIDLVVGVDAAGTVQLSFGDRPDAAEINGIASALTSSGFVGGSSTTSIDDNDPGYPLLVLRTTGVFEPGPSPEVRIDLRELCQQTFDLGYTSATITLTAPGTSHQWLLAPPEEVWEAGPVETCADAPSGTLSLRPQPWRWFAAGYLLLVCLAANIAMLRLRRYRVERRSLLVGLGLVAVAAAGIGVFTEAGAQADNLVAHGLIDPGWFATLLDVLPVLVLPLGVWAFVQLVLAVSAEPRTG